MNENKDKVKDPEECRRPIEVAVVLLSGGIDSTTLLHYVRKRLGVARIHALSLNYGQTHDRELEMARLQARDAGVVAHPCLDMGLLGDISAPVSALTGTHVPVPELKDGPDTLDEQPVTYVPHRNLILLGVAAAYAESNNCDAVFYGAQSQDRYGYWDCTPDFVARLNAVLALNRGRNVHVYAPFVRMSKADVVKIGLELGVDYSHTWTCYRGGQVPCGTCPSCVERRIAFSRAGGEDPLVPR